MRPGDGRRVVVMARVTTVPAMYLPMMGKPSVKAPFCVACGTGRDLDQHHVVPRSAGRAYDDAGRELSKPTLTLCGPGNAGGCHGLAHSHRLHFRWAESVVFAGSGRWEMLVTEEPCDYLTALSTGGWAPIGGAR